MTSTSECPSCGNGYKCLGKHWRSKSCQIPSLTDKQLEIATGLLLGDGNINSSGGNPRLRANMTNKFYLSYLDDEFGMLSTGLKFVKSAEESALNHQESGFNKSANAENYSDVYSWSTRRHPELNKFAEWYSTGEKIWPEDIELTTTTLKHWYCCDGHYYNKNYHNYISIAALNECKNKDKIDKLFETSGLPKPNNYSEGPRSFDLEFTVEQSKELFDYMGKPIDGFDYKWP